MVFSITSVHINFQFLFKQYKQNKHKYTFFYIYNLFIYFLVCSSHSQWFQLKGPYNS